MSTTVNGATQTPFGREARSFDGKRVINYSKDGHVAVIEMDDPPANTYTHEMMRQLDDAILDARFDGDVEVILLTGKGEKFFSAGANIGMLNSVTPEFKYMFCLHANETLSRLEQTPKLVIAAINGHSVGGGLFRIGGHFKRRIRETANGLRSWMASQQAMATNAAKSSSFRTISEFSWNGLIAFSY